MQTFAKALLATLTVIIGTFIIIGVICSQSFKQDAKATTNIAQLEQQDILHSSEEQTYKDGLVEVRNMHKRPGNFTVFEVIHLGDVHYVKTHATTVE